MFNIALYLIKLRIKNEGYKGLKLKLSLKW